MRDQGATFEEIAAALGVKRITAKAYITQARVANGTQRPVRQIRRKTLIEKMWANVNMNGPQHPRLGSACWLWLGVVVNEGYGQIGDFRGEIGPKGRRYRAHRLMWALANNQPIPDHGRGTDTTVIRHKCDNPLCVNPQHLEIGTQMENIHDALARGRLSVAKYTVEQVREVRARYAAGERICDITRAMSMDNRTVWGIVHRKNWRHVA